MIRNGGWLTIKTTTPIIPHCLGLLFCLDWETPTITAYILHLIWCFWVSVFGISANTIILWWGEGVEILYTSSIHSKLSKIAIWFTEKSWTLFFWLKQPFKETLVAILRLSYPISSWCSSLSHSPPHSLILLLMCAKMFKLGVLKPD